MKRREFILSALALAGCHDPGSDVATPEPPSMPLILPVGTLPTVSNGQTFTLNLPTTGSKDHAATLVFDQGNDAGVGATSPQWAAAGGALGFGFGGAFTGGDSAFNPGNVLPGIQLTGSTIPAAHSFNQRFFFGSFAYNPPGSGGAEPTIVAQFGRSTKNFPRHTYITYKYKVDPLFVFGFPDGDDNWKDLVYTDGALGLFGTNNYFYEGPGTGQGVFQNNSAAQWQTGLDQCSLSPAVPFNPDNSGHGLNWPSGSADYGGHPIPGQYLSYWNPANPANGWVQKELRIRWMTDSTGYIQTRESPAAGGYPAKQVINYQGQSAYTSAQSGSSSWCEAWVTCYTRNYGTSGTPAYKNAIYLCDHMYDQDGANTYQAYLHDQPTLTGSTYWEPQKYTSWINGTVTVTVNIGTVPAGVGYFTAVNDAGTETTPTQVNIA